MFRILSKVCVSFLEYLRHFNWIVPQVPVLRMLKTWWFHLFWHRMTKQCAELLSSSLNLQFCYFLFAITLIASLQILIVIRNVDTPLYSHYFTIPITLILQQVLLKYQSISSPSIRSIDHQLLYRLRYCKLQPRALSIVYTEPKHNWLNVCTHRCLCCQYCAVWLAEMKKKTCMLVLFHFEWCLKKTW